MVLAESLELIIVSLDPVVVNDQGFLMVDLSVIFDVIVIEKLDSRGEHLRRDYLITQPGVLLLHKRRPEGFLEEAGTAGDAHKREDETKLGKEW